MRGVVGGSFVLVYNIFLFYLLFFICIRGMFSIRFKFFVGLEVIRSERLRFLKVYVMNRG